MKILYLSHVAPYPPLFGVTKRNFYLLEEMAKRHHVSLISYGSEEEEKRFREQYPATYAHVAFVNDKHSKWYIRLKRLFLLLAFRSSFRGARTREFQETLDRFLEIEQFDLIFCSTHLFGFLKFPGSIPCIATTHNVEYDIFYRAYKQTRNPIRKLYFFWEYMMAERDEILASHTFKALLATSDRDLQIFKSHLPDMPLYVIPNGVDIDCYTPLQQEPEPRSIIFTGLMNYFPNEHGILYFLETIFPLIVKQVPDTHLYIVGANPSKKIQDYASRFVTVTGFVDDTRPYVARSSIFIIPLLVGGGTRLKALEAMAMKRPIVSTTLGCEGISVHHTKSAILADDPQEFANWVVRLFEDRALYDCIVRAAYDIAIKKYSWKAIGEGLEQVVAQFEPSRSVKRVAQAK